MSRRTDAGFTLLEVLVAVVILSVAVVTLVQLASQALRLLNLSSDYQQAVLLADRVARAGDASIEGVETGHEGQFDEGEAALHFTAHKVTSAFSPSPPGAPSAPRLQMSTSPWSPGQHLYW